MKLLPAIDLRDGRVVRLHQGDFERATTYGDDPLVQAGLFEAAGARWLHLVDLDGARAGRVVHWATMRRICDQTDLKVQVGGGIRRRETIDRLLEAGVARIVLGTAALTHWDWFERLMDEPAYHGRLVLGLDARQGRLAVGGWERTTPLSAAEVARRVAGRPLGGLVYTDIATDGTLAGPNVEATGAVARAADVGVIASGGVGTLEHLRSLRPLPLEGAIVGRALYERAFSVEQAIAVLEQEPAGDPPRPGLRGEPDDG